MRSALANGTFIAGTRPAADAFPLAALGSPGTVGAKPIALDLLHDLDAAPNAKRRRKLWEIEGYFHCPIIGTCLSTAELRDIMRRVDPVTGSGPSDHAMHQAAVRLAGRHD